METGIGEALIALVADLLPSLLLLVSIACRLLGLGLFLIGALRLLRQGSGTREHPAAGTALTFLASAVLFSLPAWLDGAGDTLFGDDRHADVLGYTGGGPDLTPLIESVFAIVAVVGLAAFIRGVFVLRAAADNVPGASAAAAAMHLTGGVAAWHMPALIGALQTTLGIHILDIS